MNRKMKATESIIRNPNRIISKDGKSETEEKTFPDSVNHQRGLDVLRESLEKEKEDSKTLRNQDPKSMTRGSEIVYLESVSRCKKAKRS